MHSSEQAAPVENRLLTPGIVILFVLMGIGFLFGLTRFLFGLGMVTNLDNQFPWGLWIGFDVVTGVALAAGGFTTSALAYVFNRDQYHAVVRPALLTAMLGYTFVALGLTVDIGRYWNIWRPVISWNPTSVLFEVAMCVILYLTVLYIEFIPIFIERFSGRVSLPGRFAKYSPFIESILDKAGSLLAKIMFLFIITGVVLSFLHQSGLGSLMLIAKYKVHPLWYTPILPLLFLLSAIAVGYPMVILESMIAAKTFKRRPEMEVLTPLARFMPVLIGLYLAVKLGDMIVRRTYIYLFDGTLQSNAFIVELLFGLILPFMLLLFKRVRESEGWLFFASTLYVLGIVLNRINVFIVSYTPPYMMNRYFPAVGELAVTIGFIAALIFLYRLFVTIFPVLGAHNKRGISTVIVLLCLSIALNILCEQAPAYGVEASISGEKRPIPEISVPFPSIEDAPKVRVLNSAVINRYSDLYEPVRFMHAKHADVVRDCTVCHHRVPHETGDTYGRPVTMKDLVQMRTLPVKCGTCHNYPWNPEQIHVPGLKGTYHQVCLGCHRASRQIQDGDAILYRAVVKGYEGADNPVSRAPMDCISCHVKNVPDHKALVKIEGKMDVTAVTKNCLSCHEVQGRDMLRTSHWQWQGPSPFTSGNEIRVDLGKRALGINNTTIALRGNWESCTGCHAGYGWQDDDFDFSDMTRMDCLVCHDTTGTYHKSATRGGLPEPSVDLLKVAQSVGRPGRANCGSCHFSGGTTDPVKHGAMNPGLLDGSNLDVHIGEGNNFLCIECHHTRNHKIPGRSLTAPEVEGTFSCQTCHTAKPHIGKGLLAFHLNKHIDHIACQTCHIPVYAKGSATLTRWDWSTAGKETKDSKTTAQITTNKKEYGSLTWKETLKPAYRWYNGMADRYLIGDLINRGGVTELVTPIGSHTDPGSRIYPFKIVSGKQISDSVYRFLVPARLWKSFRQDGDWNKAAREGADLSGLKYSGKYEFVETLTYQGLNHEVLPTEQALSCSLCHPGLADEQSCGRCHEARPEIDFKSLALKGIDLRDLVKEGFDAGTLIGRTDYVDFKALGYAGDPIEVGGRFRSLPLKVADRAGEEE